MYAPLFAGWTAIDPKLFADLIFFSQYVAAAYCSDNTNPARPSVH